MITAQLSIDTAKEDGHPGVDFFGQLNHLVDPGIPVGHEGCDKDRRRAFYFFQLSEKKIPGETVPAIGSSDMG
jgi:hypothetical protein